MKINQNLCLFDQIREISLLHSEKCAVGLTESNLWMEPVMGRRKLSWECWHDFPPPRIRSILGNTEMHTWLWELAPHHCKSWRKDTFQQLDSKAQGSEIWAAELKAGRTPVRSDSSSRQWRGAGPVIKPPQPGSSIWGFRLHLTSVRVWRWQSYEDHSAHLARRSLKKCKPPTGPDGCVLRLYRRRRLQMLIFYCTVTPW